MARVIYQEDSRKAKRNRRVFVIHSMQKNARDRRVLSVVKKHETRRKQ